MKFQVQILLAGAFALRASGHALVTGLWVNDEFQGQSKQGDASAYIRQPPNNSPVKDLSSQDIICNVNNKAVPKSLPVKAGDKITFEWMHNTRGDDIIDPSHKGPVTVYIASAKSNGIGNVWTKLAEEGLLNGNWAVDKLIQNKGKHSVNLPKNLKSGDYLLRAEVLALHEANNQGGAQFYPSCSQITVSGSGSEVPSQNFNFIGGYKSSDPGIFFNMYNMAQNPVYTIPGPRIGKVAGGSGDNTPPASPPASPPSTPPPTSNSGSPPAGGSYGQAPKPSNPPKDKGGNGKPNAQQVPKWSQCGGKMYTGPKKCVNGTKCQVINEWYFQCL